MKRNVGKFLIAALLCVLALAAGQATLAAAPAAPPPARPDSIAAAAAVPLDPEVATQAYLATVTLEDRARSDAYFAGDCWLNLWGFLYGLGVALLLLATKISARMRDLAGRMFKGENGRNAAYVVQYILATTILGFPLTLYAGFFREHKYGLLNQSFGPWLGEQAISLAVGLAGGTLAITLLYLVLRKLPRTWWLWGAGAGIALMMVFMTIGPVFIAPLFNKYKPLDEGPLKASILSLARANGVPADNVYQFDASRQSKRVSANVSGFLGTTRISLNDNLLNRCTPAEVRAVLAHEIGHYVLNHVSSMLLPMALMLALGFAFVHLAFGAVQRRWGRAWGVAGIADIAGLPLLAALLTVFFFALAPLNNTMSRADEAEADLFGLNAAREPDAFSTVCLKLGEYRKLAPGRMEEWLFFDHPSGYHRIYACMRWKKEMGAACPAAPGQKH